MTLRLATFNIEHGAGAATAEDFTAAIASLDADIIALQEVDRGQIRSAGIDLACCAATALTAADYCFTPSHIGNVDGGSFARRRAFRHERPGRDGFGIATISRFPVIQWIPLRLPLATPWLLGRFPINRRVTKPDGPRRHDQPRVALAAIIATPDGPFTVVNTHLSTFRGQAQRQLFRVAQWCEGLPRPLALVGDFNLDSDTTAAVTTWPDAVTAPTFPRSKPRSIIDHVLLNGSVTAASPARVVDVGLSDHCAVVVDVAVHDAT